MVDWCANTAATLILYLRKEAVLRKTHVLNQAIAALRRSEGLPGRFITVWNIEPDIHTSNYYNSRRMRTEG